MDIVKNVQQKIIVSPVHLIQINVWNVQMITIQMEQSAIHVNQFIVKNVEHLTVCVQSVNMVII